MDRPSKSNADKYLAQHPAMRQWVHSCAGCGFRGYRPDMPDPIGIGMGAYYLKRFFVELPLNSDALCSQCAAASSER